MALRSSRAHLVEMLTILAERKIANPLVLITKCRVPDDVAVVGFDDHPALAPALTPPLTSIHQDPREQVRQMVALLMDLLAGEPVPAGVRMLPVSIAHRGSA